MKVPVKVVPGTNNRRWLVHAVQVGLPAVYGAFVDDHTRNSVLAPLAECKSMAAWMSRQSAGSADNATAGNPHAVPGGTQRYPQSVSGL